MRGVDVESEVEVVVERELDFRWRSWVTVEGMPRLDSSVSLSVSVTVADGIEAFSSRS